MIKGHLSDEGAQLTADRTPLPQTLDLIEGLVGRIVQFIGDVAQMSPPPDGTGAARRTRIFVIVPGQQQNPIPAPQTAPPSPYADSVRPNY